MREIHAMETMITHELSVKIAVHAVGQFSFVRDFYFSSKIENKFKRGYLS
jgi:hypothetical protein